MKNSSEGTLKEIQTSLKKIQERSSGRKLIFAIIGISVLLIAILFAVLKFKKKLDEEIEEEIDDDFYDDDEEIREDYYALDYEDEE